MHQCSEQPLLMVVGMPRSGTTLLARIISKEMSILFPQETHFFSEHLTSSEISVKFLPKEVLLNDQLKSFYEQSEGFPRTIYYFRKLLAELLDEQLILAEKTPSHLPVMQNLLDEDPNIFCIIIQRNCFDVVMSLKSMPWNKATDFSNFRRCLYYHRVARRLHDNHRKRVMIVQYKELCNNPKAMMTLAKEKICHFCGVDSFLPFKGDVGISLYDENIEPWKKDVSRPVSYKKRVPTNFSEWIKYIFFNSLEYLHKIFYISPTNDR